MLLVSWVFVFQVCMHATLPPNEVTHNYSLFLFCGFLPWLLFQETVIRSASSLLDNTNLITKTVFPAEIVPVSIFLSSLISHLMALALVIAVVGIYNGHFSLWMLSLPIYMLLIGLFAIGVGWFVSSLQVYLRDTAQVISVILTFWFWMTPIFINEQQVPETVPVCAARESAGVSGASLSRPVAFLPHPQPARAGDRDCLCGDGLRPGRPVLPPPEARLRGRAVRESRIQNPEVRIK